MGLFQEFINKAVSTLRSGTYGCPSGVGISRRAIFEFQAGLLATWLIAKVATKQKVLARLLQFAERQFKKAASLSPLWVRARRHLGGIILFQGRRNEAMKHFEEADLLRDALALELGFEPDREVFLSTELTKSIGGIGQIDAYLKYQILNNDPRPYYLLARSVANGPFLNYWRSYLTIVTDPAEIDRLSNREAVYGVNWFTSMPSDLGHIHVHSAISNIQGLWSMKQRAPLLQLETKHADLLAVQKKKWGMEIEKSNYLSTHSQRRISWRVRYWS